MSYASGTKSSAELEREVEEQRTRVEARIDEIKDRLSPGQLLDEALAYTKDGGQHFASNLGHTISANPLPATLLGVSLIWLMTGQGQPRQQSSEHSYSGHMREPEYPYARIGGTGLRRTGHRADEYGQWWSEFETGDGGRYRAKSNEKGHRLGHFMDESGKLFGGFIDEAGNRVKQFQDESGNLIDEASGWASHTWSDMQQGLSAQAQHIAASAQQMGQAMQKQTDQLTRQLGVPMQHVEIFRARLPTHGAVKVAGHSYEVGGLAGLFDDGFDRVDGRNVAEPISSRGLGAEL